MKKDATPANGCLAATKRIIKNRSIPNSGMRQTSQVQVDDFGLIILPQAEPRRDCPVKDPTRLNSKFSIAHK
jgi:hypothetical protein